ncbi:MULTISPECIES: hypothetical protein [Nocardia]|uniref:hypothetical protein n=1 Tax=Nocardia TaxID=1817 RepID=UPI002455BC31|nr:MULTISPECIES: hypothetical protein [Nocardia]
MTSETAAAIVWAEQPETDIATQAAELEALANQLGLQLTGGNPIVVRTGPELARIVATLATGVIVVSSTVVAQGWLAVMRCCADVVTPLQRWQRIDPDADGGCARPGR